MGIEEEVAVAIYRYQRRSFIDNDLGQSIELGVREPRLRFVWFCAAFLALGFVPIAIILLGGKASPHAPTLAWMFYYLPVWVLYLIGVAWELVGQIWRLVVLPVRLVVGSRGFRLEYLRSSETIRWSQVRSIRCGSPKRVFPSFESWSPLEIDLGDPHTKPAKRFVFRLGKPWPPADSVRLLLEKSRAGEDPTLAARVLKP